MIPKRLYLSVGDFCVWEKVSFFVIPDGKSARVTQNIFKKAIEFLRAPLFDHVVSATFFGCFKESTKNYDFKYRILFPNKSQKRKDYPKENC